MVSLCLFEEPIKGILREKKKRFMLTPLYSSPDINKKKGCIFLHCLGNNQQQQFATAEKQAIELVQVKVEGGDNYISGDVVKTQEFLDTLIKPNLFTNIHEFETTQITNPMCELITFNPHKFSHHLPITYSKSNQKDLCTTKSLEKATRWRTCFRDCEGTDRFPIKADPQRSVSDAALDVLNGIPQKSGFGVAFGLIHDLLEQLQDVFLKDNITQKEIVSTEKVIEMITSGLAKGLDGDKKDLFLKGLLVQDAKILSKKLLIALYLVAKRFKHDSDTHGIVSTCFNYKYVCV
jgi:hypothetical protein